MFVDLRVELAGISLRNPTILASGILGSSYGLMKRVEKAGAGAITSKTITKDSREGYPNPVFVDLGFGYLNAMGLPNPGVQSFESELRKAKAEIRIPIIVSVGGKDEAEFQRVAERLLDAGCDGIELNLSCPHVRGYGLEVGSDVRLALKVIKAVKGISSKPVFAKTSIFQVRREIIERYLDSGIDGITAINTIRAMAISVDSLTPILSNEVGGLSGPCIKPIALAAIYELHKEFPDIPLIGVGGIDSWRSGLDFILAGATAIGIGSAIVRKDLKVFEETVSGLRRFLSERGFKSIRELIGYAHKT